MRTEPDSMTSSQDKSQSEGEVRLDITPGTDYEDADTEERGWLKALGDVGIYRGFDDVEKVVGRKRGEGLL